MRTARQTFLLLCFLLAAQGALAQAYPSRAVTWIIPWPPGGTADIVGRLVARRVGEVLGANVVIENRGGAGGTLGAAAGAAAAPDGYTLTQLSSHHAIAQALYAKPGFDIDKSFVAIAQLVELPNVLVVRKDLKAANIGELIALAKSAPAGLTFGSAGNGSGQHLAGEAFKKGIGANLVHVPYKGAGPAMQDLMGGRIDLMFEGAASAVEHIRSGTIRALAVTTLKRPPSMAELPTLDESGIPRFESYTWHGLYAPAGTPAAVTAKLNQAVIDAFKDEGLRKKWAEYGSPVAPGTPRQFETLSQAEVNKWAKAVAALNLKID